MTSDNTAILFEPITVNATFSETGTLLTTRSTSSESEIVTRLLALLKASPTATALAEFAHKRDLQIGIDRHQDRLARLLPAHRMIALNPFRLEHRDPDIAQGFMALALAHALRDHWQHTHGFAPSPAFHPNDNIRLNRVLNADATALVVLIAREMKENGVYTPATALRHPRTSLLPAYRILAKTRKEIPNVMLTGEDVRDAYLYWIKWIASRPETDQDMIDWLRVNRSRFEQTAEHQFTSLPQSKLTHIGFLPDGINYLLDSIRAKPDQSSISTEMFPADYFGEVGFLPALGLEEERALQSTTKISEWLNKL